MTSPIRAEGIQQAHPGIALAERGERLHLLGYAKVQRLGAHHRVDALRLRQAAVGDDAGRVSGKRLAKRVDAGGGQLDSSGGTVAPVSIQVRCAGVQRLQQVEPGNAPARAARPSALVDGEDDRRLAVMLDDPRGDDADDAGMPPLAGDHQHPRIASGLGKGPQRGLRRVGHAALGLPPLVIGRVELGRNRAGASGVPGQHQLNPGVGAVEASRGIEAGGDPEGDVALVEDLGLDLRDRHQSAQTRPPSLAELGEPATGKGAILADQRHEISDRRQRDEVQVPRLLGGAVKAPGSLERGDELVGDGGPAEAREGIGADLGVDDRAIGKRRSRLMVVGDDRRDAHRLDSLDLRNRPDPAVGRDQQAGFPLAQVLDTRPAQPVAIRESVGNDPIALRSGAAHRADEDRRRAHPVDVVVAVDRDPPAGTDRGLDRIDRDADPLEALRIVRLVGIEERPRLLNGPVAAADQRDRDRVSEAELVGEGARLPIVVRSGGEG